MSDKKRTPRQGPALPGKSPRPAAPNGSSAARKGSGAKPPLPKAAPPVRSNPATRSIPVVKPQQPASNGHPGAGVSSEAPGSAKPAKPGKAARKVAGTKRPATGGKGLVAKGLLGSKGGSKRPAVRLGPGAKKSSGPADEPKPQPQEPASKAEPSDSKDTAAAKPAPLPDLAAHTETPAWLSPTGSRDEEIWDGAFEAENTSVAAVVEPEVIPAEDVHLAEPSLETPAISSEAAEAASLPETAAEVRAVSEEAAEAGKQAGISEPAPEGTEVAVEPSSELTDMEPAADAEEDTGNNGDGTAVEHPAEDGAATDDAAAEVSDADSELAGGEAAAEAAADGAATHDAAHDEPTDDSAPDGDGSDEAAAGDAAADDAETGEAAPGKDGEPVSGKPIDKKPDAPAEDKATPGSVGAEGTGKEKPTASKTDAKAGQAAGPKIQTSVLKQDETDVAGPVTDSFASLSMTKKDAEDSGLIHTVNPSGSSAVPADSRRARRTREAEEAAQSKGASRTTRMLVLLGSILIVVLLGIWLATIIADSNREAGVLEDSVAPVDLEAGACLKDFQSVNAEVTVVTCDTPHNAQLVATQSYAESDTFPGTDSLAAKAEEVCSSVIYTDAASKYTDLELNRAVPTQNSWNAGDRRVDCFVVAAGEDLTESLIVQP